MTVTDTASEMEASDTTGETGERQRPGWDLFNEAFAKTGDRTVPAPKVRRPAAYVAPANDTKPADESLVVPGGKTAADPLPAPSGKTDTSTNPVGAAHGPLDTTAGTRTVGEQATAQAARPARRRDAPGGDPPPLTDLFWKQDGPVQWVKTSASLPSDLIERLRTKELPLFAALGRRVPANRLIVTALERHLADPSAAATAAAAWQPGDGPGRTHAFQLPKALYDRLIAETLHLRTGNPLLGTRHVVGPALDAHLALVDEALTAAMSFSP